MNAKLRHCEPDRPRQTVQTRLQRNIASNLQMYQARFPFKLNRLRCVRCVNENRKKRKRLRCQAANHGCHCFDRAFLLAGACVCCVKISRKRLRLNGNRASYMQLHSNSNEIRGGIYSMRSSIYSDNLVNDQSGVAQMVVR